MHAKSKLLPSGFVDLLPPYAQQEREMRCRVMECFSKFGYEEVSPPLCEFDNNLSDKAELEQQTFRVMDMASQRMMGLRADMTPQIARIAASRMDDRPLPLRLCYAGTCLRVKGEGLSKSRQLVQAGLECIGVQGDASLVEILRCVQESLLALGIEDLSLDITLPGLVEDLLKQASADQRSALRQAIEQKDRTTLKNIDSPISETLSDLLDGTDINRFESLLGQLPTFASSWLDKVRLIDENLADLSFTLDPLEESGFGYYDGIAFSLFSSSLGMEIGRGGRYIAHDNLLAYGLTLYLSPLLSIQAEPLNEKRCLIVFGADEGAAKDLREKGWQCFYSQAKTSEEAAPEAAERNCTKILEKDCLIDV